MKPIKKENGFYYVDVRWSGYPRIQTSTRTTNLGRAKQMVSTLERLKTLGRRDILGLIAAGTHRLDLVHDVGLSDITALDNMVHRLAGESLGTLVAGWFEWLRQPSTLAPRTRKAYAPGTVERYSQSWEKLFEKMEQGREARLSDLTKGFVAEYRRRRMEAGASGPTVNRDIVAIQSFLRWAQEERDIEIPRFAFTKEAESPGRERWLSADEIALAKAHCAPEWWILFAMLMHTGMRVSEAQGLSWADVRLQTEVITVRDRGRAHPLKTRSSNRDVPITKELASLLVSHAGTVPSRPVDPVFPGRRANRRAAHKKWVQVTRKAGIPHATVHDLRHTFGVHALIAGIPLPRLQKLMGHSTPTMTLRYTQHVPQEYFQGDAELLAKSLAGGGAPTRLALLGGGSATESKRLA